MGGRAVPEALSPAPPRCSFLVARRGLWRISARAGGGCGGGPASDRGELRVQRLRRARPRAWQSLCIGRSGL
jgi:hypothetical protein